MTTCVGIWRECPHCGEDFCEADNPCLTAAILRAESAEAALAAAREENERLREKLESTKGWIPAAQADIDRAVETDRRARADDAGRVDDGAPRRALAWFARRMERKLKLNDHKDHWTTCEAEWLFDRMQDEREELLAAMPNEPWELSEDEKDKIIDEAADVANFAMMIADIARQAMPKARAVLAAADGKNE